MTTHFSAFVNSVGVMEDYLKKSFFQITKSPGIIPGFLQGENLV